MYWSLLSLLLLLLVLGFLFLLKFHGVTMPRVGLIVIYSLTITATIITTFSITSNYFISTTLISNDLNELIKNIGPLLISTIGLIITSTIALSTSSFNNKKQYSDLILSLIQEQKKLTTTDFSNDIDSLIQKIENSTSKSNVAFTRMVDIIKSKPNFYINHSLLDIENIQEPLRRYYCDKKKIKLENISNADIKEIFTKEINTLEKRSFLKRDLEQIILVILNQKKKFKGINYNNISDANRKKIPKKIEDFDYICLSYIFSLDTFYNSVIKICSDKQVDKKEEINLLREIDYEEAFIICNEVYKMFYPSIGHYFKHLHRIFKLINKHYKYENSLKKEYQGILRSQLSEKMLLVLYYNCTFTYRGLGLGAQLKGSSFWGDNSDFTNEEIHEISHISMSSFWFSKEKELNTIKNIYTKPTIFNIKRKIQLRLLYFKKDGLKKLLESNFNN